MKNLRNFLIKFFIYSLFFFSPLFTFAQVDYNSGDYVIALNNGATITFPYKINFTNAELTVIKNLDRITLEKLVQVARQIKSKNLQSTTQTSSQTASSTIYSNTQSNATPYYNPLTGQYQSKPVTNTTNQSNPYLNPTNSNQRMTANSANNPYAGTSLAQPYADAQNRYGNDPYGGQDTSLSALTANDMKDLPKLGSGNEDCSTNFGTTINMSGTTERLRFDTSRLCKAFGKKILGNNAKRSWQPCTSGSQHGCGTAIDFNVNGYGDRKQQALLIVAFISLGYNVASYERSYPLHADHEESGRWKTWSRWAHTNGMSPLPYELAIRDALNLIGMPANSAGDFVSQYGRPSKSQMAAKAKAYLQSVYGNDANQFTPASG